MENTYFKICIAAGGAAVSYLYGGWSDLLGILLAFVVVDYMTGFLASATEGKLSSAIGCWGIAKKVCMFVMVAVAHMVDKSMGQAHLFRDATIFFYLANELLSMLENMGRVGVPIPPLISEAVAVLQGKSGKKD